VFLYWMCREAYRKRLVYCNDASSSLGDIFLSSFLLTAHSIPSADLI